MVNREQEVLVAAGFTVWNFNPLQDLFYKIKNAIPLRSDISFFVTRWNRINFNYFSVVTKLRPSYLHRQFLQLLLMFLWLILE